MHPKMYHRNKQKQHIYNLNLSISSRHHKPSATFVLGWYTLKRICMIVMLNISSLQDVVAKTENVVKT